MGLQLQARQNQLVDLKRIIDSGADRLADVAREFQSQSTLVLDPESLITLARLFLNKETAQSLIRQLLSLHGLKRQTGLPIDAVFDSLREVITQQGPQVDISIEEWNEVEPTLKTLVETPATRVVSKAIDLAYDYTNLFRRTKIITDIRPLYDDSGESIEACIVSYTLRLRYDSADGEHEVSIALDESDLKQLVKECERATVKASAAKHFMENSGAVPCRIAGDNNE